MQRKSEKKIEWVFEKSKLEDFIKENYPQEKQDLTRCGFVANFVVSELAQEDEEVVVDVRSSNFNDGVYKMSLSYFPYANSHGWEVVEHGKKFDIRQLPNCSGYFPCVHGHVWVVQKTGDAAVLYHSYIGISSLVRRVLPNFAEHVKGCIEFSSAPTERLWSELIGFGGNEVVEKEYMNIDDHKEYFFQIVWCGKNK